MLEIIGAGFGRTGTTSLKTALEELGFGPCHYMLGLFDDPAQIPMWRRAARGDAMDWSKVFAGYRSSVDWPSARFWRELAAHFPNAKVILTVRDPESWYVSALSSIYAAAVAPVPDDADPLFVGMRDMSLEVVWDGQFGGRFVDRAHAIRVFEEHNAAVMREIPPERLLTFDVSAGWAPLCGFLGVPVPDEPFPHSNDRSTFTSDIDARRAAGRSGGTIPG